MYGSISPNFSCGQDFGDARLSKLFEKPNVFLYPPFQVNLGHARHGIAHLEECKLLLVHETYLERLQGAQEMLVHETYLEHLQGAQEMGRNGVLAV